MVYGTDLIINSYFKYFCKLCTYLFKVELNNYYNYKFFMIYQNTSLTGSPDILYVKNTSIQYIIRIRDQQLRGSELESRLYLTEEGTTTMSYIVPNEYSFTIISLSIDLSWLIFNWNFLCFSLNSTLQSY